MGERGVRNAEVEGSNPLPSTIFLASYLRSTVGAWWRLVALGGFEVKPKKSPRGRSLILALAVTFGATVASPAFALEGRLVPLNSSSSSVIVWRSKDAMDEGDALMRAKADPRLVVRLAACAVKSGTRAVSTIKTEGGMFSGYALAVTVIEGPFSGCRGFVALKEFQYK